MNEKFLDKLFRIYSIISYSYAQTQKIEQFLIASYYMSDGLIYPYEYIDFDLMYRFNNKIDYSKTVSDKTINLYINDMHIQFTDIAIFLYEMHKKMTNNLTDIIEKDILKLNDYYKQIL